MVGVVMVMAGTVLGKFRFMSGAGNYIRAGYSAEQ
jgi:hypothetical protein